MIGSQFGDCKLSRYDAVRIDLPSFTVLPEEVQAEMQRIALRHATTAAIEPREVNAGDIVRIDIYTIEDNKEFGGLTKSGVDVQLGLGILPKELEIALLGHRPGETVTVVHRLKTEDVGLQANIRGQEGTDPSKTCGTVDNDATSGELVSTLRILELRAFVVPELTDEWVGAHIALAKTVEQFQECTAKRLLGEKKREYLAKAPYIVMEKLGERLLGELPADLVHQLSQQLHKEFLRFLEEQNLDLDAYLQSQRLSRDDYDATLHADAEARIRQDLALMAYARHHGITVSEQDLNSSFLLPTPEKTHEARQNADQSGLTTVFWDLALRSKAAEHATINSIFINENNKQDEQFAEELLLVFRKQQMVREHIAAVPLRTRIG